MTEPTPTYTAKSAPATVEFYKRADVSPADFAQLRRELAEALAQNETLRDALKAARESEALLLAKLDAMGDRIAMMQSALDERRGYQTWGELKS